MSTDNMSAIDKAIALAKARAEAKKNGTEMPAAPRGGKANSGGSSAGKPKVSDEEKAARAEQKNRERLIAKAARDEARAVKRAAREAAKIGKTPHMSKVEKAAANLPQLSETAQEMFDNITVNLSRDQVNALAIQLQHFNRVQATQRALTQKITEGSIVTITGGNPKYVGMTGVVTRAQRIRCYVSCEGVAKEIYLFTSDCEVNEEATSQAQETATGTDG